MLPPRQTLITHPRLGRHFWPIVESLPAGTGLRIRLEERDRAERLMAIARQRGLVVSIERDVALAHALGADVVHDPATATDLPFSLPVHDESEAFDARERSPAFVYVSPIYPTRSHPGAPALGPDRARALARRAHAPAIALGGVEWQMDWGGGWPFVGWAGIDTFRRRYEREARRRR